MQSVDVVIIGAGPAGSVAAAFLEQAGIETLVIEQSHFPRFSIGESLLPQCMDILAEAGLLDAVQQQAESSSFQYKDGAVFTFPEGHRTIEFADRFMVQESADQPPSGWDYTYQVQRAPFDQLLIEAVQQRGVECRFGQRVTAADCSSEQAILTVEPEQGAPYEIAANFVLDASGYGRVLPRLLDLEKPSDFPARQAVFTHLQDNIVDLNYQRDKIRIAQHAQHAELWFWLIPFANGRMSVGAVGAETVFSEYQGEPEQILRELIAGDPDTAALLAYSHWDTPVRGLQGYAANVSHLYGDKFALLGNAAEFLDPIFSSGVTIAMQSARLAAGLLIQERELPHKLDWAADYAAELQRGVDVFRAYVQAWYSGELRSIFTAKEPSAQIESMICGILAGYVWDPNNPYNHRSAKRLSSLRAALQMAA